MNAVAAGLKARIALSRGSFRLDVTLDATPGETIGVLGPNGGGKTSAVLSLAGVLPIDQGAITVGGHTWDDGRRALSPEHRQVGLMLADSLLFPNLTALDNVAYGPRSRGASRVVARQRALDELDRVGLADKADAKPTAFSSGQAARVALARALATDPALLLLDEPLAALDPDTRARTRSHLRGGWGADDGGTVLVTHDPLDALTLADRLVFIEDGRVAQTGSPADVLHQPRSPYVATVVGLNLYAANPAAPGALRLADGSELFTTAEIEPGSGSVWATISPSAVTLHASHPEGSARNVWHLRVAESTIAGQSARVALTGAIDLTAEITLASLTQLGLLVGTPVWASVKATEVKVYPR